MKKLVIYGKKMDEKLIEKYVDENITPEEEKKYDAIFDKTPEELLATLWVNEKKKLVIEAKDKEIEKALIEEIYLGRDPETTVLRAEMNVPGPPEEVKKELEEGRNVLRSAYFEIGDDLFLNALKDSRIPSFKGYLTTEEKVINE